jgi:hypothetical protein
MSSTVENKSGNGRSKELPRPVVKDIEFGRATAIHAPEIKLPEFCASLFDKHTPLDDQVGGDHYKHLKVQPFVTNFKNWGPEVAMGEIINRCYSFVASYRSGDPDLEEIDKIVHEAKMLGQLVREEMTEKCQASESSSFSEPCSEQKST